MFAFLLCNQNVLSLNSCEELTIDKKEFVQPCLLDTTHNKEGYMTLSHLTVLWLATKHS
jgi:hypothetical protein